MAERLRRWTANPLGYARAGSNPADVDFFPYYWIRFQFVARLKTETFFLLNSVFKNITKLFYKRLDYFFIRD